MEFLWAQPGEVTLQDIIAYCSTEKQRYWKQQTVYTFLTRLENKGIVSARKQGQKRYYSAAMTYLGFQQKVAQQFLEDSFEGSLKNFVHAFTGGNSLTEEEKKELEELLNE
jgi:BlaI family penicillinase repressor